MSISSVYWEEEIARRKERFTGEVNKKNRGIKLSELEQRGYEQHRIVGDGVFPAFFMIKYNSPIPVSVYYRTCMKQGGEWIYEESKAKSHIGLIKSK